MKNEPKPNRQVIKEKWLNKYINEMNEHQEKLLAEVNYS